MKIINNINIGKPSTNIFYKLLKNINIRKVLFIDTTNLLLERSLQNIKNTKFLMIDQINVFDLVLHPYIFITTSAFRKLICKLFTQYLR